MKSERRRLCLWQDRNTCERWDGCDGCGKRRETRDERIVMIDDGERESCMVMEDPHDHGRDREYERR